MRKGEDGLDGISRECKESAFPTMMCPGKINCLKMNLQIKCVAIIACAAHYIDRTKLNLAPDVHTCDQGFF